MEAVQGCRVYHFRAVFSLPLGRPHHAHAFGIWRGAITGVIEAERYSQCNVTMGCAGDAAHNALATSAPAAPLPCLGLQDRLPVAPAQQAACRGPAQHRPAIGGTSKNNAQSAKSDASELFHEEM